MSVYGCKNKKDLKARVGEPAAGRFQETSMFGFEYRGDGTYCVVGPSPDKRVWYASVKVVNGKIASVK